jgi:hypothetical protein
MPVSDGAARTMLRSPFTNNPMVAPIAVRCIGKAEALAEKWSSSSSKLFI